MTEKRHKYDDKYLNFGFICTNDDKNQTPI